MKQALLVVSFGTSVPRARQDIEAVERVLAAGARACVPAARTPARRSAASWPNGESPCPACPRRWRRLRPRGGGCGGAAHPSAVRLEYDKLKADAAAFAGRFARLALGRPLAADSESLRALAACMVRRFGQPEGGALVLLGHGTEHFANMVYPAMQTALRLAGGRRAYMGTVEGWPGFDEVLAQLKEDGCGQALLVPFMLVAGDHALNDMAGDGPKSWKSRLEAAGVGVRCRMRGLGALPEVQALYGARLREIV
ncbi:MAG: sirohydrochlorin cobaltochelatase [Ruthenibacterium lactatiformans]